MAECVPESLGCYNLPKLGCQVPDLNLLAIGSGMPIAAKCLLLQSSKVLVIPVKLVLVFDLKKNS